MDIFGETKQTILEKVLLIQKISRLYPNDIHVHMGQF